MRSLVALLTVAGILLPIDAMAQTIPLVTSSPMANGDTEYALGIQILMVMTVLTLLPAMLITMTAFTRILIVLAILRQALGTAQTPSNQIILGLSLFLTLFIMSPVIDVVWSQSLSPFLDGDVPFDEALNMAQVPLREFMFAQTRESDLAMLKKGARLGCSDVAGCGGGAGCRGGSSPSSILTRYSAAAAPGRRHSTVRATALAVARRGWAASSRRGGHCRGFCICGGY